MATAPDIATLFAYESEILPGWVEVLNSRGVKAFVEFSDENKAPTPFVDVFLDHVVPTGHQYTPPNSGRLYYDAWSGYLVHRVWTQRGTNSDQQAPILKLIRAAAIDFVELLDDDILPYHDVMMLKESPRGRGLTRGVDAHYNLDWSELPLDIQFAVRADSWPA
jgi:hypothetical protein